MTTFLGTTGDDTLTGVAGNDTYQLGTGNDTINFNASVDAFGVLTWANGFDTVISTDGGLAAPDFDRIVINFSTDYIKDRKVGLNLELSIYANALTSDIDPGTTGEVGRITLLNAFSANPADRLSRLDGPNGFYIEAILAPSPDLYGNTAIYKGHSNGGTNQSGQAINYEEFYVDINNADTMGVTVFTNGTAIVRYTDVASAYPWSFIDSFYSSYGLPGQTLTRTETHGDSGSVTIDSFGSGSDFLVGNFGNDSISGGDGNDTLSGGVIGNDTLDGGAGNDTATFDLSMGGVNVSLLTNTTSGAAGADTLVSIENLTGSSFADNLTGDNGDNRIEGGGGNDTLIGGVGNDSLLGGAGADTLNGGAGNDFLDGGIILDRVNYNDLNFVGYAAATGAVNISFLGITGDGSTALFNAVGDASVGTDTLQNINFIQGSGFNDTITGSNAQIFEQIEGGAGNDTLNGGAISSSVNFNRVSYQNTTGAGVTVDLIAGTATGAAGSNAGNDVLSGFNQIRGSNFADTLLGSDRTDFGETFEGRDGNDFIDGKGGFDTLRYDTATGGVTANLALGAALGAGVGSDTFQNIEALRGSTFNDVFTGDAFNNTLDGQAGDDSLLGAGGADTLLGGAGNDTLDGGVRLDTINGVDGNFTSYSSATAGVSINLTGITGDGSVGSGTVTGDASVGTDTIRNIDLFQGSNFNDTILGSSALIFEQFEGGAGNDSMDGGAITDTLNGDNSNRVNFQNAFGGGVTVDFTAGTAVGVAGSNVGSDTLVNFNQVRGSEFNDTLLGSDRVDQTEQFEGRGGNDYIDGKGGFDLVRYTSATSQVVVNLVTGQATGAMGTDTFINIEGIIGGAGGDILTGGNAANGVTVSDGLIETFRGEGGFDTIDGGQGFDRSDYTTSTAGVVAVLNDTLDGSAQDGLGGFDVLRNIEGLRGSAFNDSLTGSNTAAFESFEGREGNDNINGNGGIDRVDYLSARAGVTVNLTTGTAADGYGGTDTLSNIENVRGSRDFNDVITGNLQDNKLEGLGGNDNLSGGDGNDLLIGGLGNDLLAGGNGFDTATFTGLKASYTITRGAGNVTVAGADGTDVLTGIEKLTFSDSSVFLKPAGNDFDGDGKSDILWRNTATGANTIWKTGNIATAQAVATIADQAWKVMGTGDFDGDGKADILWRNATTGANTIWKSGSSGAVQAVAAIADLNWKIAGTGDFDGDGKADILWRNTATGADTIWKSGSSATVQAVAAIADQNWKIAGTGDFDGDGKSDILWRNTATGADTIWKSGSSATVQAVAAIADQNWKIVGTGDFDGDGKSDILWRNSATGGNTIWKSGNSATAQTVTAIADQNWKVTSTGDFDGDGKADILWRNTATGADTIWKSGNSATTQTVNTLTDLNWAMVDGVETGDLLTGGAGNNTLQGTVNADLILGGAGADVLTGGLGADLFRYINGTQGNDVITDFLAGTDHLQLVSSGFGGLALGALGAGNLVSGAAPVANLASAQFLYNTTSGQVSFDADGTGAGAAVNLVTLVGSPPVTAADFLLVA